MKLLIVSDIHANWPALRAVLEAEADCDDILCLGDLVDYGPQPRQCVEWAMQHLPSKRVLQGNHDWGLAWSRSPLSSAAYWHLANITQGFSLAMLGGAHLFFLRELRPELAFLMGNQSCFACHALPSDPLFHYLPAVDGQAQLRKEIALAHHPAFLFLGHTHLPMVERIGPTTAVNPGSVGQPKDGDPRASYAIWQDGEVSLRRAAYDVEETIRAYGQTPLKLDDVACLAQILRTGGKLPEAFEPPTP